MLSLISIFLKTNLKNVNLNLRAGVIWDPEQNYDLSECGGRDTPPFRPMKSKEIWKITDPV